MINYNNEQDQIQAIENCLVEIKENEVYLVNRKKEIEIQLKRLKEILGNESCQKINDSINGTASIILLTLIKVLLKQLKKIIESKWIKASFMSYIFIKSFIYLMKYFDPVTCLFIAFCFIFFAVVFYLILNNSH